MKIRVPDMSCPMCFGAVERAVSAVKGVHEARVEPKTKEVVVQGEASLQDLLEAIRAAEYHPEV